MRIEIWDKRHGGLSEATRPADVFKRRLDRVKAMGMKEQMWDKAEHHQDRQLKNYMGLEKGTETILKLWSQMNKKMETLLTNN